MCYLNSFPHPISFGKTHSGVINLKQFVNDKYLLRKTKFLGEKHSFFRFNYQEHFCYVLQKELVLLHLFFIC